MSKVPFRLPLSHLRSDAKNGERAAGRLKQETPILKRSVSKAALLASAAIRQAKQPRPFKRPSDEMLQQFAFEALATWLACAGGQSGSMRLNKIFKAECGQDSTAAVQEVVLALTTKVDELSAGPYVRIAQLRSVLEETAKRTVALIAARLPFRSPSVEVVDKVAAAVAKTRWSSTFIKHFDRVLMTYCSACLGYKGRDVVQRYLHDHIRRNLEDLKSGPYIRTQDLYEIMDIWAQEEVHRIEELLLVHAENNKALPENQSPRGFDVVEIVIRYGRTRRCYLIVEQAGMDKLYIKALKSSAQYKRNQRKRFNRNARTFSNLPKGKRR